MTRLKNKLSKNYNIETKMLTLNCRVKDPDHNTSPKVESYFKGQHKTCNKQGVLSNFVCPVKWKGVCKYDIITYECCQ